MKFQPYLTFILPIIVLTLLGIAYGQKDSFLTYTHPDGTFTLQYPNDWKVTKQQDGKVLFAPNVDTPKVKGESFRVGTFGPTISVTIKRPMYSDQTSIEVCELFTNFLENTGYAARNEEKTLPNVSDKTCMVQFNTKGERIQTMHGERNNHPGIVFVIRHGDLVYIIGYETTVDYYFNKYLPVMEQVINSFRIL